MSSSLKAGSAPRVQAKNLADLGHVLGVGERQVQRYVAEGMPVGEAGQYDVAAASAWHRENVLAPAFSGEDPDMGGTGSPALERYRLARAEAAEMDLAERRRETVRLDVVKEWFPLVFGFVRRAGERLQKRFGAEAGKILNEELESADRAVVEHTGGDSANDSGG